MRSGPKQYPIVYTETVNEAREDEVLSREVRIEGRAGSKPVDVMLLDGVSLKGSQPCEMNDRDGRYDVRSPEENDNGPLSGRRPPFWVLRRGLP